MKIYQMKNGLWIVDYPMNWMIVNKYSGIIQDAGPTKEILEYKLEYDSRIRKTLHEQSPLKNLRNYYEDYNPFKIVLFDEKEAISQGYITPRTEEEYNRVFYPSGKVK